MTRILYRARWTQRGAMILINHDGRITVRRFKLRDKAPFTGAVRQAKPKPSRQPPNFTTRHRPRRP